MRLASYNVENMFDRAKALNGKTWNDGKGALEAHRELNEIFNKQVYSAADRKRIVTLLKSNGMAKSDEGPFLILRKIRGKLLVRPQSGPMTVVANGRADWIGWVELKTEPVKETASENIARVLGAVGADVVGVVEAEDRTTLRLFNQTVLEAVGVPTYDHTMLIDGNDERGIDVGLLTKRDFPIVSIRSHVDARDTAGIIFSRDCAEYQVRLPSGVALWVMVNHLKSKGYGSQTENNKKRRRQAVEMRKLYDQHMTAGERLVAIIGDFNDTPDSNPLAPLFTGGVIKDISSHPLFQDGGRPGTHGNCTASSKLDYILLSPDLYGRVKAAGVERRGMWGGTNGALWPHFDTLKSEKDAASDHAALWVDLQV